MYSKHLGQSKQFNFWVATVNKAKGIMKSKAAKLQNLPPEDHYLQTLGENQRFEGQGLTSKVKGLLHVGIIKSDFTVSVLI